MPFPARLGLASCLISAAFALAPALAAEPEDGMDHPMDGSEHCGAPVGEGVVNAVNLKKSTINISHKPIAAIGMSGMTMDFTIDASVSKSIDLAAFNPGTKVHFLLTKTGKAPYAIAAVCAISAADHEACMGALHKAAMKSAEAAGRPCDMDHGAPAASDAAGDHKGHH